MGGIFVTISEFFFARPDIEFRLSIIGFPNAGKTTILHKMKFGDSQIETTATIGMNLEEISIKNVKLKVWDLSG
jgi:GTPase SAR1 family protein